MIRALFFDCFGVLATDAWRAFCDSLPAGADTARASELNRAYDKGFITDEEFRDGVFDAVGAYPPAVEDASAAQMGKNTALIAMLPELRKTCKIGLISNISSSWITDELLTQEEQQLFDDMVLSYQVGLTKPSPEIFELALRRLSVRAEDAVMIDDREWYIAAARDIGMRGIVYTDIEAFKSELQRLLDTNQ